MIYYGKQNINKADIDKVTSTMQSPFLTQGPAIEVFERKIADYCSVKYAVAFCNATAALHACCFAAGLKKGDVLWTVPNTFVASANCGLYCGADVDFVDIDNDTYNMDVDKLEQKLKTNKIRPKIVVPVHFAGQSCQMEKLASLAKEYKFTIIEDASHAIGALYKNEKIGSCKYSDMTVFSFHPVKIITTGEGGMVLTNNVNLYERLALFRSHGITKDPKKMLNKDVGPWYYEQIELGYNLRMTDLQAALGISQMDRIDVFLNKRRILAKKYDDLLKDLPLKLPYQRPDTNSSWHLYVVRLDLGKVKNDKKDIFARMLKKDIVLNLHYIPVHMQPYYQNIGFKCGDFPVSEQYYKEAFTIPLYYDLTDEEQKYVAESLKESLIV